MLKLINIKKSYKTGTFIQDALTGVNIDFRSNEFVAILGASGSGKTTLLNIIGGLDRYDNGDLIINNKSTKQFSNSDWDAYRNNSIGFVFQSYNLISHISVLENVEMGMTLSGVSLKKRRKKALEVLDQVGIKEHSHKRPNQLSGGQMQRVAIARALANDPDIILADEPTGALDSQTSVQILELIKEISKEKLVIMVTHNSDLAYKYANRIIKIKDGEIEDDTNSFDELLENSKYQIRKTSMSFLTALKLSFNNIFTKKGRTLLTAFASSIGIIGIALILSLSNGFDKQIQSFEMNTLASFPIMVNQQSMEVGPSRLGDVIDEENNFPLYPQSNKINIFDRDESRSIHQNKLSKEYLDYLEKIDFTKVMGISYVRSTNFNLLKEIDSDIKQISYMDLNFSSLPIDYKESKFIDDNFELLYGSLPSSDNEILIEVDSRNRIDAKIMEALYLNELTNYEEFIGYEMKLISNNDYYQKLGDSYIINDLKDAFNSSDIDLKIVGVLRPKEGSVFSEDRGRMGGFYHTNELASLVISNNRESDIVLDQKESDINLLTGQTTFDKEQLLIYLGSEDVPVTINIFPKDFESKDFILNYLDEFNIDKANDDQVLYTDLAATISNLSSNIMNGITIVLIAFSSISLVVSSVMIGIITYISVIERTKEIGILRALGARKKDITRVFNAETFIIGLTSGLLGILITRILIIPTNIILFNITSLENIAQMNIIHITLLLIVSIILTLLGGFIPAKMASRKDPVEALRTD